MTLGLNNLCLWWLLFCLICASCWPHAEALAQEDEYIPEPEVIEKPITEERRNFALQTQRGRVVATCDLGVGLGVSSQNIALVNSVFVADMHTTPRIGYFITNGLMVAAQNAVYFSIANFGQQNAYELRHNAWGIGLRYYHPTGVFGEFGFGRGLGYEKNSRDGQNIKNTFVANKTSVAVGIGNFWGRRFNIELAFRYSRAWGSFVTQQNTMQINGFSVTAGVSYAFGKMPPKNQP